MTCRPIDRSIDDLLLSTTLTGRGPCVMKIDGSMESASCPWLHVPFCSKSLASLGEVSSPHSTNCLRSRWVHSCIHSMEMLVRVAFWLSYPNINAGFWSDHPDKNGHVLNVASGEIQPYRQRRNSKEVHSYAYTYRLRPPFLVHPDKEVPSEAYRWDRSWLKCHTVALPCISSDCCIDKSWYHEVTSGFNLGFLFHEHGLFLELPPQNSLSSATILSKRKKGLWFSYSFLIFTPTWLEEENRRQIWCSKKMTSKNKPS